MKILQQDLNRIKFVVWEMKRNVSVAKLYLYVSECVCSKIIKELPDLVGSGTPFINIQRVVKLYACKGKAGSGRSFWSCSQAISKPLWYTPLLRVQWKTPDDGQRNCAKHAEFYSKNKFEKLVHLVACSQAVSITVWHIPLLCVQWKTPDDGQRNCPKHAEFYSKNKFEKLGI